MASATSGWRTHGERRRKNAGVSLTESARPMIFGDETEAMVMPKRRGPERARLAACVPLSLWKHHSIRSPGWMGWPLVFSMVTMPPMDTVKNSSVLGPVRLRGVEEGQTCHKKGSCVSRAALPHEKCKGGVLTDSVVRLPHAL